MSKFFTDGFGSGVVSGGLGLISNIINNAQQRKAEQRQFNYQKELMGIQNQQQIDFWKMNNEYNSPANQRKLVEEAGLNPDFYFSNGGAFTPAQMATAAQGAAPETGYSPIEGERMYLNAVQSANWRANTENTLADASLKEEQAITEGVKRDLMETERLLNLAKEKGIKLDNEFLEKTLGERIESILLGNEKLRTDIDFTKFSQTAKGLELQANLRLVDAQVAELNSRTDLSYQQKLNVAAQTFYQNLVNEYFHLHEKLPSNNSINEAIMDFLQIILPPKNMSKRQKEKAMKDSIAIAEKAISKYKAQMKRQQYKR